LVWLTAFEEPAPRTKHKILQPAHSAAGGRADVFEEGELATGLEHPAHLALSCPGSGSWRRAAWRTRHCGGSHRGRLVLAGIVVSTATSRRAAMGRGRLGLAVIEPSTDMIGSPTRARPTDPAHGLGEVGQTGRRSGCTLGPHTAGSVGYAGFACPEPHRPSARAATPVALATGLQPAL
jgi:hypothetical protein